LDKRNIIRTTLILLIIGLFSLHSCCTKKYCSEAIFAFELYNFNPQDVDTITISKYEKGSNFSILVDFTTTSAYKSNGVDYYYAYLETVDKDHEYIVKIQGVAVTNTITEIKISKSKCNTCFPYTPKREYYTKLSEYRLNGKITKDFPAKIYK